MQKTLNASWTPGVSALLCALSLTSPRAAQAQFEFTTNNGTLTLSQYTGFDQVAIIPATAYNMPVVAIGDTAFEGAEITSVVIPPGIISLGQFAFAYCAMITNVSLPSGLRSVDDYAFAFCSSLPQVAIPNTVTNLGRSTLKGCSNLTVASLGNGLTNIPSGTFWSCGSLSSVTIGDNVRTVGAIAFVFCSSLSTITVPASVTVIQPQAFASCPALNAVYFQGSPPLDGGNVFTNDDNAIIYYVPGITGWGPMFAGRPTALWYQPTPRILSGGIQTNVFGFTISWATNIPVVVEASSTVASPLWSPLSTNTLVNGASYFSDPHWTNFATRFYRLHSL